MEGWKTLIVSLGGLLVTLAGLVNVPLIGNFGNWLVTNAPIVLPAVFAIFAGLRMVTTKPAAISLKK